MSGEQKARARGEQAMGAARRALGKFLGDRRMANRGRAQLAKGHLRQAKERAKDGLRA